jgi:hypothetical protein
LSDTIRDHRSARWHTGFVDTSNGGRRSEGQKTPGILDDAGSANPDNNFRFDPTLGTTGGYIFNLKTTGLATGTYAVSFVATGDPTTHTVQFQVN